MSERSLVDRLDDAVEAALFQDANAAAPGGTRDAEVDPLLQIAGGLRDLPRAGFRARCRGCVGLQAGS